MNKVKMYDAIPCDGRKSFYGKAKICECGKRAYLKSYETIVCSIDAAGKFHRHWNGESMTTMRHINAFLNAFGIDGGGVAWWRKQAIENFSAVKFFAGASF